MIAAARNRNMAEGCVEGRMVKLTPNGLSVMLAAALRSPSASASGVGCVSAVMMPRRPGIRDGSGKFRAARPTSFRPGRWGMLDAKSSVTAVFMAGMLVSVIRKTNVSRRSGH
jgi:hypothetical protein